MKQFLYGLVLYLFLLLPPVAALLESIMIIHMHMQMPLLILSGFLMARLIQLKFPDFFRKWNSNGVPGIMLFSIILVYWMIPRTMDEALTIEASELFKFISLPFLAGVPLRDSWKKISSAGKNSVFIIFIILFSLMGWLYIAADEQICNNYLRVDQITLGWGYVTMAVCMAIYVIQLIFGDHSEYK
ncbi:hypothetical protein [Virgibacillus oceani]|uniref:Uncharacterized protein n=1 Tax=Virgibacillus oceani TaxID=1479511 RepID=A0A917HCI7_9BACI|nr:hypothetical protein [Virgibacillus oceani]GGG75231.1 hypothetical protein GCM10011398_20020 [Virgibacillus oceani]